MKPAERVALALLLVGVAAAIAGWSFAFQEGLAADAESRGGWLLHWWMLPLAAGGVAVAVGSGISLAILRTRRRRARVGRPLP